MEARKFVIVFALIVMMLSCAVVFAGDKVECYTLLDNQSVTPSSTVTVGPILLSSGPTTVTHTWKVRSDGVIDIQPIVTAGTFNITVYWSDFNDPTGKWSSGTTVATGLTSTDTDCIEINPNGVHLWMKLEVTETSGSGSPALSLSICSN